MTEPNFTPVYQIITEEMLRQEQDALGSIEKINREDILQSLSAIGYDTKYAGDRLNDVLTVLVEGSEWDVEHAVAVMDALEDDSISEDEVLTIFNIKTAENTVKKTVDDSAKDARDEFKRIEDEINYIITLLEDETEDYATENISFWANPFAWALNIAIENVANRLEGFIANMIGVEREK